MGQDFRKTSDKLEELVQTSAARLRSWLGDELPNAAVVLGSGFQDVLHAFRVIDSIRFSELPGFPALHVAGHGGVLHFAEIAGWGVLICAGRAHYYEGHDMSAVTFAARVLGLTGVKELFLTNAAGGISPGFRPGDFMVVNDHINFTGVNPLRGERTAEGRCFVDMTEAYSRRLRSELHNAATTAGLKLQEGVYLGVSGPSYETPAEIRAFRTLGADAVGMSTIPEVLMARYLGMEVAALSCITNRAAGLSDHPLTHDEVIETGRKSSDNAARLFQALGDLRSRATPERPVESTVPGAIP